ncbi:MAG: nitroreductase family protein [Actinomycetota bacterium]
MSQYQPVDGIDVGAVDNALTTTRAVRLRLDLERPVSDDLIFECIDIAEQAPSGGNQGSRRWVIVRDQSVKEQLADLYMAAAGEFMIAGRDRLAGSGHRQEKVMRSAAYLAEHYADVPAIVVPTIIGVHDGSGRPGLFDSVIQSVWSFCVAARARGLGTSWTTAGLAKHDELIEALGIPSDSTPIAMIPLAYTKGTEFKTAPRFPARDIAFIDRYGSTWERGPSDPPTLADGPGTIVEVDVAAKPSAVWELVTDIEMPVRFSEELIGARWADGFDGPALGAQFIGRNQHSAIGEWEVPCFVDRYVEGAEFGWAAVDRDNPGARWWFEVHDIAGATRLRFGLVLGPGPSGLTPAIERMPEREPRILQRRIAEHRANMQRVVDGVRDLAEAAG